MSGIFDEKKMFYSLEQYLPEGEVLTAGIHGIGIETQIKQVFGKCVLTEESLIPSENGAILEVNRCKYADYDIYIGITQHYLILSECEVYKHYYEFNNSPNLEGVTIEEINTPVLLKDIGTCFPFTEIQNCIIKNAWMGSVKCTITMKNGSILKLMFPKRGGLGNGMPHHAEYREAIIACLSVYT